MLYSPIKKPCDVIILFPTTLRPIHGGLQIFWFPNYLIISAVSLEGLSTGCYSQHHQTAVSYCELIFTSSNDHLINVATSDSQLLVPNDHCLSWSGGGVTYWELIIRRVGGPQGGHPLAQELEAQEAARGKISALSPSNLFKLFSTICFPFSTLFKPALQPFTYPRSVTEKGHQVTQFLDSATCLPLTHPPTFPP